MKYTYKSTQPGGPLALVLIVLCAGLASCGPDPQKLKKEVDRQVRAEVDRRLRQELPRMEARLRAQLSGSRPAPAVAARPRPLPSDPAVDPKLDPKTPEPAMAADPKLTAEPKADDKGLTLKRHVIVKQVKDRKAMGEGTSFAVADGQVYCYLDAVNPKGPERFLSVAWIHDGKPFHTVKLRVGKGHVWRTWARLRLRKQSVGKWHCTVSNEEGQLLSRAEFTVQ